MKVWRGLFRLWLVLSALWVAGVLLMAWSSQWRVIAIDRDPTAQEIADCQNARTWGCHDKIVEQLSTIRQFVSYTLPDNSATAFGVPAFVLVLGFCARWIVAGFKKSAARHEN
jgi:hypothetical protein